MIKHPCKSWKAPQKLWIDCFCGKKCRGIAALKRHTRKDHRAIKLINIGHQRGLK